MATGNGRSRIALEPVYDTTSEGDHVLIGWIKGPPPPASIWTIQRDGEPPVVLDRIVINDRDAWIATSARDVRALEDFSEK